MARGQTRGQLWNSPTGRSHSTPAWAGSSGAFARDSWRNDPSRNPALWDVTADDEALAAASAQNKLTHDLLMKEQARKARATVEMLRRANAQPQGVNLFEAPTSPEEARLQGVVQDHVDAGARGFTIGAKQDALNRKAQMDRLIKMQDLNLDRAKYQQDIFEKNRDFKRLQANDKARIQYQQDLLQQGNAREAARMGEASRRDYNNVAELAFEMVRDKGMDPEEAGRVFGLKEPEMEVLRSIGAMNADADASAQGELENYAALLNQMELSRRDPAEPPAQSGLARFLPWTKPAPPRAPSANPRENLQPLTGKELEELLLLARPTKDQEGLAYDPSTGFSVPPRAPRTQRPQSAVPAVGQSSQTPPPNVGIPVARTREEALALKARLRSGDRVMVPNGRGGWMVQYVP